MGDLSEVFWSLVLSSSIAFCLALGRLCYKSKCSTIEMPCLKIVRNIETEIVEDSKSKSVKNETKSVDNVV